jgi:hypothetical protein
MLIGALGHGDSTDYVWDLQGSQLPITYQCKRTVGAIVTDSTLVAGVATPVKIKWGPFES